MAKLKKIDFKLVTFICALANNGQVCVRETNMNEGPYPYGLGLGRDVG